MVEKIKSNNPEENNQPCGWQLKKINVRRRGGFRAKTKN